jgi:DnaJ-class molecular chaperone
MEQTLMLSELIDELLRNRCLNCEGRGFNIVPHTSPDGLIEPNEVQECEICNGTGTRPN